MSERYVKYRRVSSYEQAAEGYSPQAQDDLLNNYVKNRGWELAGDFYESETATEAGRTEFDKMVSFLKKNPSVKHLIVEKNDRITRNEEDTSKIVQLIRKYGIHVHLV